MMDPRVKKLWVDALRSGEYKQGRGWLCQAEGKGASVTHTEPSWCCLGVLADVTGAPMVGDPNDARRGGVKASGEVSDHFGGVLAAVLPGYVKEALKLDERAAEKLVSMNDTPKLTFYEIADWIDKNL